MYCIKAFIYEGFKEFKFKEFIISIVVFFINSPCFYTSMYFTGGCPFYPLAPCLTEMYATKPWVFRLFILAWSV